MPISPHRSACGTALLCAALFAASAGCDARRAAPDPPGEDGGREGAGGGNDDRVVTDSPIGALSATHHVDDTEIVDVPDTGISLGWGWSSYDHRAVPAICVEFVAGEEPAQTQTVDIEEVSDNYEVMQHIAATAEGSVSALGVEVSGSAAFAKDVNIDSSSSNFLLNASVQNGVRYAAPVPRADAALPAGVEPITPRGGNGGEIRLTDAALALARQRDIGAFQQACGDSFVASVFSGAKLTALISISTSSRAEKEALSASVSGSGWGVSMSAKANASSGTSSTRRNSRVSVLLTGGRNEAIPTTVEEVVVMTRRLAIAAYEAPKDFHMAITPYEALAGWPGGELLGAETEYDQLADRWGFYTSLYDEIQHVLDAPESYRFAKEWPTTDASVAPALAAAKRAKQSEGKTSAGATSAASKTTAGGASDESATDGKGAARAAQLGHLRALQDEVLLIVQALTEHARLCTETGENPSDGTPCTFDHERYPDPYRYRIQLPPPLFLTTGEGGKIVPDPEEAQWTVARWRRDTLQQQVIDKAKRRCQLDAHNLGCLSNAAIEALADELIGKRVLPLRDGGERHAWLRHHAAQSRTGLTDE